ncbi:MAG: ABC transporter ATP-binding protein [Solirubrobacterales bacterium]
MSEYAIELRDVSKSFGSTAALRGATLEVLPGELFGVLGPSGCGKSTLLRILMGFERPDRGEVIVGGRLLSGPDGAWVPPERRHIGMVVQDYALFPHLDVAANAEFGLHGLPRGDRAAIARRALELVGLQHKASSYPHELSGGERQRVALARALAPEPDVVLLDEPFSSLDASLRADLRHEVELILREVGATAILVTHDQEEALSLSDRLAVMRSGRVVQTGDPRDIYWHPAERWVAQFVGDVNVLPGLMQRDGVRTDIGVFDLDGRPAGTGHVHVAIRPEQLELQLDPAGDGEVVEREFYGHDVLYRVRHESGRTLLAQSSSVEMREVGDRVRVRPGKTSIVSLVD